MVDGKRNEFLISGIHKASSGMSNTISWLTNERRRGKEEIN